MYSILFNLCSSPGFYHRNQNFKKTSAPFLAEKKCIFSHCFIQNWEDIESLKNEKSPGIVLEFCFPISVRTLPTLMRKLQMIETETESRNSMEKVILLCSNENTNQTFTINDIISSH